MIKQKIKVITQTDERLKFVYGDNDFTITPDFDGKFRINKSSVDNDRIEINPGCSNEILVG